MGRGFGRAPVASLFVGLLAAFPPLVVASMSGVFETPDSGVYLTFAQMLVSGPLPRGEALLGSSYSPIPLFRTPGYPAVIALLQFLTPTNWLFLLLGLQILGQAVLAAYAHQVGLALGLKPPLAFLTALMPAVGSVAVFQSAVMSDALFSAAMLLLLHVGLVPDEKQKNEPGVTRKTWRNPINSR